MIRCTECCPAFLKLIQMLNLAVFARTFPPICDIQIVLPLGMSLEPECMAGQKTEAHLLRAPSDIRLHKGPEPGFLFSHLSRVTFTLHVQTKASQKRGEHRIINIQLAGAAANDLFCCFVCSVEGLDMKGAIAYELQVKGCWNGEGYRNVLLTTDLSHHPK